MTHSQQVATTDWLSRSMGGSSTAQSCAIQNSAKDTIVFKALGNATTGIYATGTRYQYITFEIPTNNIFI
jgi:hypothetical protein